MTFPEHPANPNERKLPIGPLTYENTFGMIYFTYPETDFYLPFVFKGCDTQINKHIPV